MNASKRAWRRIAAILALALHASPTLGLTYKCQAPNGRWTYQDQPCAADSPQASTLPDLPAFEPTAHYRVTSLRGFRLLIAPGLDRQPAVRDRALKELDDQLGRIATALPPAAWNQVQKLPLWIEASHLNAAARFNKSAEWLRSHGFNPDKAGAWKS
jgi:hypothetical protein